MKTKSNTLMKRIASGLQGIIKKDFGVTLEGDYGWSPRSGGRNAVRYPGSDLNWEAEAGDLTLNTVVSICMQYVMDQVVKPELKVVKAGKDASGRKKSTPIDNHPALQLLSNPNGEYSGDALLQALAVTYKIYGDAYAVKVRGPNGVGTPRELWYVPPWRIEPVAPDNGGPTEFYKVTTPSKNGSPQFKLYPRADVIHYKNGLDLHNQRGGFKPFRALLRGIVADNEIDAFTAVILQNLGVFGAIVSPDAPDTEITPEIADALKRKMRASGNGDNRGGLAVFDIPIKVAFAGRTPQDMALTSIGDRPQARISGAFGIDPSAVYLLSGSGGKGGEKYGSMRKEAREQSFENGIIPMLGVFAKTDTAELLPDFLTDISTTKAEFDYSEVRDLQPDLNEEYTRHGEVFKNGGYTLNEYREKINEPPAPEPWGSMFWWQLAPAPAGEYGVPDDDEPDDKDKSDDPDDDDEAGDDPGKSPAAKAFRSRMALLRSRRLKLERRR